MSTTSTANSIQNALINQLMAKIPHTKLDPSDDGSDTKFALVDPESGIQLEFMKETRTITVVHQSVSHAINVRPLDFTADDFKKAIVDQATKLRAPVNYFLDLLNGNNN